MHLRVLTYNVHKCIGPLDRRYDPERVAQTIAHYEPDIVMLQEVAQRAKRFRHDRQVEKLGALVGLRHRTYFVNVRFGDRRGEYGNAILSRFPISETSNTSLKVSGKKPRSVLHARLRVRIGKRRTRTLHLFNMHLGLSGIERKIQLRRFLSVDPFAGLDPRTPIVVGGDFNDVWGTLGPKLLQPAGFRGQERPAPTFPAFAPIRALDGIWVRGQIDLRRVQVSRLGLARSASDHLPLIADAEIVPAS